MALERRSSRTLVALLLLVAAAIAAWQHWQPVSDAQPAPTVPVSAEQSFVLAVTWFPAFCAEHGNVPECRGGDHRRLALHGLWPDGGTCPVSPGEEAADWNTLPAPELTAATWAALRAEMPGTQSHLERHEWLVHGRCSGVDADLFFSRAASFAAALDRTGLEALLAANAGKILTRDRIRALFDQSFGAGAGDRVRIGCNNQGEIDELTIALSGAMSDTLATLLHAARPRSGGCTQGRVVG